MEHTISVKELREEFPRIREELQAGKSFTLIYHSKPLAEIYPISQKKRRGDAIAWLANPPKEAFFRYPESSVDIIRKDREE